MRCGLVFCSFACYPITTLLPPHFPSYHCLTFLFPPSLSQLPRDLTKSFVPALFTYVRDFHLWKVPDEAKLVSRIKHALVALYQARLQLPPDEPEDSQLNTEFRTQILRLRQKMRQIAGEDVLLNFDRENPPPSDICSGDAAPPGPDSAGGSGSMAVGAASLAARANTRLQAMDSGSGSATMAAANNFAMFCSVKIA